MFRLAIAAISAMLLLTACSGPASVKQARQAVDIFHAHFNNDETQAIWDASSSDLTSSTSEAQFSDMLRGLRGHYGKVVATEQQGWRYKNYNGNSFSRLEMKTTFEKGTAYEQFTFRNEKGGKQLLAGWSLGDAPPPQEEDQD